MLKMICLDLDGTLLNYEKQIDSQTSRLLNKLSSNGVEIVIATGRHYDFASFLTRDLTENRIIIANNGAGIFRPKDNKAIRLHYLDSSIVETLTRLSLDWEFEPFIYVNPLTNLCDLYTNHIDDSYIGSIVTGKDRMRKLNLNNIDEVLSLVITGRNKDLEKLKLHIDQNYAEEVNTHIINSSYEKFGLLEVMDKLANKWDACQCYANKKKINSKEIIAFGDEINDIEMIRHAGIGIAMKNSIDAVKLYADKISKKDNNKAGIYHELMEMIEW